MNHATLHQNWTAKRFGFWRFPKFGCSVFRHSLYHFNSDKYKATVFNEGKYVVSTNQEMFEQIFDQCVPIFFGYLQRKEKNIHNIRPCVHDVTQIWRYLILIPPLSVTLNRLFYSGLHTKCHKSVNLPPPACVTSFMTSSSA